jgi:hypothetical protein
MKNISLYQFAKKYIVINDGTKIRHFNDTELKRIKNIQKVLKSGVELKYIKSRKGSVLVYEKRN